MPWISTWSLNKTIGSNQDISTVNIFSFGSLKLHTYKDSQVGFDASQLCIILVSTVLILDAL